MLRTPRRTPRNGQAMAAGIAVASLLLSSCALRVPHDRVVAANQGAVTVPQDTLTDATQSSGGAPSAGAAPTTGSSGSLTGGNTTTTAPGRTGVAGTTGGAAPSSGGTSGSTTDGTIGAAAVCKGSGTVVLGSVAPYGAAAVGKDYAPGRDALKIWEADVNQRGGICGRKVQVIVEDDQGNASKTSAALRDLVENKKVAAIIAWGSALTLNAGLGYLEDKKIPVLGGDILNLKWSTSPVLFPQGAGYDEAIAGALYASKRAGAANKLAFLYCAEAQACSDANDILVGRGVAQKSGTPIVYSTKVSISAVSFASECQQAQQAGADIMFLGGDSSFVERVANSCAQQGIKFRYTTLSLAVNDQIAQNPNFQNGNFAVGTTVIPWMSTSTSGAAAYQAAYKRYYPDLVNSGLAIAWWTSAKLAEAVIASLGSADVNPVSVMAAARKLKGETLGGLTGPLTYGPGGQGSPRCFGIAEVGVNKWQARDNGKLTCRSGAPLTQEGGS